MESTVFWALYVTCFFALIVIGICTRKIINELKEEDIYNNMNAEQILAYFLVNICIVFVVVMVVITILANEYLTSKEHTICLIIIFAPLAYLLLYVILDLDRFKKRWSRLSFAIVFIISTIGMLIPIYKYNWDIEINTETTTEATITETTITSTQERQLLYFCNIPVQKISGEVSGSSFLGTGNMSGSISTLEELPYWYLDENNYGVYDSAATNDSKIVFISDEETPRIVITSYCTYTKTINHNNEVENTTIDKEWVEYFFYLPEAIMQYPLE